MKVPPLLSAILLVLGIYCLHSSTISARTTGQTISADSYGHLGIVESILSLNT